VILGVQKYKKNMNCALGKMALKSKAQQGQTQGGEKQDGGQ
jgi:hypothetical protein